MSEDSHDAPTAHASSCSQCGALRSQLAAARTALEAARPIVKHRAVDGSAEADSVLDLIANALAPAPLGTSAVPGTPPP